MAIWIVRAGRHGEFEQKFLQENRVYVTWDGLATNLSSMKARDELHDELAKLYPDAKSKRLLNWVSQIWPFAHDMKQGDLVVVPLKTQRVIYIGEISGSYHFDAAGPNPFYHWRPVKWIGDAIPRTNFAKDLLNSFGAAMTICRVQRHSAETRLQAMRQNGWKPETNSAIASAPSDDEIGDEVASDLEERAQDQIARLINAKFKGHGLARLVDAILRAQGYTTYLSPEGADGGADILAGTGSLGFGPPQLCVEVKSEASPIDRPTVDKLLGAVEKFRAEHGLFVAWGGFKSNVLKELAPNFFKVRLWTGKELIEQLFESYDRLDDEIKAELPLKRIWVPVSDDE